MTSVELHMTSRSWHELCGHLFPGDGGEHGAVLLCGVASTPHRTRLLVRDVIPAQDGVDYVPGERGHRHLTGHFVTHQVRRAKDAGLVYLAVHNHGGTTSVSFSRPDLMSHERGYPTLRNLTGMPVGALVVATEAIAGDIWLPDGQRADLVRTIVAGQSRKAITAHPSITRENVEARYARQARIFGLAGQSLLGDLTVGVVGSGGIGMLLVEYLARLGVGHLIVIDPDRVDRTNLPRLTGATRLDAMEYTRADTRVDLALRRFAAPKIRVARRIARRANRRIDFVGVQGDVADERVARRITDCDFLFLAADTMLARNVVNQIAYQYLIPTLQVGSKVVIEPSTGELLDVFGVVRTLGTGRGCLHCNGLIDALRLAEESLGDAEQVRNQRYVDDPGVTAPSVVTVNAMAAGWASNDFLHYAVGLDRPAEGFRILRVRPVAPAAPHITVQEPTAQPMCIVCGEDDQSSRGMGDQGELPTRI